MSENIYYELKPHHKPGDKVCWTLISGESFRGTLLEWDNGTAIVRCTDGKTRSVRGD